ncbi:T9SS type B sorting domain-containing protein [Portibacter marinus]|uniref:T9SS type B sorting domain-containing protein n=1 Tax=Portibacter marinus TaxID=2898660 RepID=UPI001F3B065A|nr:gliding motility-associated C-terminal domain-containing protein [Portibacter marinus]
MRTPCKIIVFALLLLSQITSHSQCNSLGNLLGAFEVRPGLDTCYNINIERLLNNDLSSNPFSGLEFFFTHNSVSELYVELTAPSGNSVILIGDIQNGPPTNGSNWFTVFSECNGDADPDISFGITSESWLNSEPWSVFTNYFGTYYPNSGCFENEFGTGEINGIWKLRIINSSDFNTLSVQRFGFLINDPTCIPCAAEAGTQTVNNLEVCTGDDLNLNLGHIDVTTNADYTNGYLVVDQAGEVVLVNLDGHFLGLQPGDYSVCAFSVETDSLTSLITSELSYSEMATALANGDISFCLDLTENCTNLTVNESPPVLTRDEVICLGESLIIGIDTFRNSGTFEAKLPAQSTDLCDTSVVLNLEIVNIQPLITSSQTAFNCNNPVITLDASSSLQESGSSFFWSTDDGQIEGNPTELIIEVSQPGTYHLDQTEGECTLRTSINLTQSGVIPEIIISSDQLSCENETLSLDLSTTETILSASWSGPQNFSSTSLSPTVSVPGDYTVIVNTSDGCQVSAMYRLEQGEDQPVISASAPTISCAATSVRVTVSNLNYNLYRWTGPNNFVSNAAEPDLPAPGIYYLEVQDQNGCKGFTSLEVMGDAGIFQYEVSGEDFKCPGGQTTIAASSEISTALYIWTGPNDYFSSSPINQVSEEGTYYIEILANGCYIRDSITLGRDISDLPEYDVQVENIGDCENPLWRLTAIPVANEFQASRFRWAISGIGVIAEGEQADVSNYGDYFLLISTFDGCFIIERFEIEPIPEAPVVSIQDRASVTCSTGPFAGVIDVTQVDTYKYNWVGPFDYKGDSSYIENLAAGFYSLTVTDTISGCVSYLEAKIDGDTIPRRINFSNTNITCIDSTAQVIASVSGGGNTYEWTGPGDTLRTRNIQVTIPGIYTLNVIGGNGCVSNESLEILMDTFPPNFTLNDTILECATQSARLDPNTSELGLLYQWEGPDDFTSTSALPTIFGSGTYNVSITGRNGCTSIGSVEILENPDTPQPLAVSLDTLNCINSSVMLSASAQNPISSYAWNGPASFFATQQNPIVSRPGEYVLSVVSLEGCIGFDTVEVIREIILPDVQFAFDDQIDCVDHTAALTGISPDPGATFSWTGPNGFNVMRQNANAIDTGTYIYTVRGSNNCVDSDTFAIGIEAITFDTDNVLSCFQPAIDITELSDSVNFDYVWNLPDGTTIDQNSISPVEAGLYTAEVFGDNGCTANVTINVSLDTIKPVAAIQQDGLIRCEDNEIILNNTGSSEGPSYQYFWESADGIINSPLSNETIDIKGIGNYQLTVVDGRNGCIDTAIIQVMEEPQNFTDFLINVTNPLCPGDNNASLTFGGNTGGTGPFSFSLDGVMFKDDSTFSNLTSGQYTFIAKDSFGCFVQNLVTIGEPEDLELDLGGNIDVFLGNDVEISANTNLTMEEIQSIEWQIANQLGCADCLSFTLTPSEDVMVELTLINENGCSVTDEIKVRIDETPVLFRPNIFSPNQDGINDVFYISANPGVLNIRSIDIFDRWGTKVFENQNFAPGDPNAGWDGTISGNNVLPGVYVYHVNVEMITGEIKSVTGDVTLVR